MKKAVEFDHIRGVRDAALASLGGFAEFAEEDLSLITIIHNGLRDGLISPWIADDTFERLRLGALGGFDIEALDGIGEPSALG